MDRWLSLAATVLAGLLAVSALVALIEGRIFLAGTLLMFTAFAIYGREITK